MEYTAFLRFIHLLLYFLIASQGAFYLIGFYKILSNVPVDDFITLRKIADPILATPLKVLYLTTLTYSIAATVLHFQPKAPVSPAFILVCAATILLIIDMAMIIKISIPLNTTISQTTIFDSSVSALRDQWLAQIRTRAYLSIGGFILLAACYIFRI